ncbi:hypothetical protein [Sphingomonas sp. ID0503]|uniref:hypothetical protein n=1 Tax=Sphingomonas sp. ID0503 TaxID=3399691 RepID=UPI003AFB0650
MITSNTVRVAALSAAAIITFGFVGAASAAPAEPAAEASAAGVSYSQTPTQANEDRKFCLSSTHTGSRLPVRECKTKSEWAAEGLTVDAKRR